MNLKSLSDKQLLALKAKTEGDINRYDIIQKTRKIQLNSAYGALGTPYFRFFDVDIAESITLSGRLVYGWMAEKINTKLNSIIGTDGVDYIVASDTDSWYISLSKVVEKKFTEEVDIQQKVDFVDDFCKQVMDQIFVEGSQELAEYTNAYKNSMSVKREAIADKGLWSIKKRYAMNVYDLEGVRFQEPKIKVVGGDVVKSSTPSMCKQAIRKVIEMILTKNEKDVKVFVSDFKSQFMQSKPEEIASTVSISKLDYELATGKFKLGTPYHCKGAIVYNKMLEERSLQKKYLKIHEGDKAYVVALKPKNMANAQWIAFPDVLPKEFGLERFIDYDKQFEKSFLTPVEGYLNVIGWKAQDGNCIEDVLFG